MPRKKKAAKEARLVPHVTPDLAGLLDRAKRGDSVRAVQAYLSAGGSASALVAAQIASGSECAITLLHAVVCLSPHPHTELTDCVRLLVAAGADINQYRENEGRGTILGAAIQRTCCTKVAQVVLQFGGDAGQQSQPLHATALHVAAAATDNIAACRLLLDRRPDLIDAVLSNGSSPLSLAACCGHYAVAEYLHQCGASVHSVDDRGCESPFEVAAVQGHVKVMHYLHQHGADISREDDFGRSSVHGAAGKGHVEAVQYLITAGADATTRDHKGRSTMHYAAAGGSVRIMEVLEQHGISISDDNITNDGCTLLMIATLKGEPAVAEWLLQRGASPDCVAANDLAALDFVITPAQPTDKDITCALAADSRRRECEAARQ